MQCCPSIRVYVTRTLGLVRAAILSQLILSTISLKQTRYAQNFITLNRFCLNSYHCHYSDDFGGENGELFDKLGQVVKSGSCKDSKKVSLEARGCISYESHVRIPVTVCQHDKSLETHQDEADNISKDA